MRLADHIGSPKREAENVSGSSRKAWLLPGRASIKHMAFLSGVHLREVSPCCRATDAAGQQGRFAIPRNLSMRQCNLCFDCLQEYAALGPMQRRHLTLQHINDGLQLIQKHQQPGRTSSDSAIPSHAGGHDMGISKAHTPLQARHGALKCCSPWRLET